MTPIHFTFDVVDNTIRAGERQAEIDIEHAVTGHSELFATQAVEITHHQL